MSEEDSKAIVGRWFTEFWGADRLVGRIKQGHSNDDQRPTRYEQRKD